MDDSAAIGVFNKDLVCVIVKSSHRDAIALGGISTVFPATAACL